MKVTVRAASYVTKTLITYESEASEETVPTFTRDEWRSETRNRDYRIWFAFNQGYGLEAICAKTGLSARGVQYICNEQDRVQKSGGRRAASVARAVRDMQRVTKEEKRLATGLYVLLEAFGGVKTEFPCLAERDLAMYGAVAHV